MLFWNKIIIYLWKSIFQNINPCFTVDFSPLTWLIKVYDICFILAFVFLFFLLFWWNIQMMDRQMTSICFVCNLPIMSHQVGLVWQGGNGWDEMVREQVIFFSASFQRQQKTDAFFWSWIESFIKIKINNEMRNREK